MKHKLFHLQSLVTVALCVIAAIATVSCGDDNPGSGPASGYDGTRLMGVGPWNGLAYDAEGRFISAKYYGYDDVYINYESGRIYYDDKDDVADIQFNGNGYVSKMSSSWEETYSSTHYTGSESYVFTYNDKGNLVKMQMKYSEVGVNINYGTMTYEDSEDWTLTLTWTNGNLTKVESVSYETENDEQYYDKETYYLSYGATDNKFKQYPYAVVSEIELCDICDCIPLVGLLGKGPAKLPMLMTCEEEWDGHTDVDTWEMSYTLNDNGTISTETFDGNKYNYSYRVVDSSRSLYEPTERRAPKTRKHGRHRLKTSKLD